MESPDLTIPSKIPWSELKAKELEELLYWLLDAMGAKVLEWRIGGSGDGTADQGRDLECFFHMSAPDGEIVEQKWWVDAKGRGKTVNPTDVKETILNAAGKPNIDVLLITTNTNFSNPTRDWVKEFQINHPKPVIKLWERTELENYCSKYPLATIRLFSKALSPQGKIEVARSRLWNYATLTDEPTLEALWLVRKEVDISPEALLALVVSECANGDITKRSWAMDASELNLVTALVNFLMNCFYFISRSSENGVKQEPFIRAIAYLVLCCIDRRGAEKTASLLEDWTQFDDRDWPDEIKN